MRVFMNAAAIIGLVASALAAQLPSTMPKVVPPLEAKVETSFGVRSVASYGGLAMRAAYRLQTTLSSSALAEHYVQQLSAVGWKPSFSEITRSIALARFSVDSPEAQMIGILAVVPFPETQSGAVSIELLRSGPQGRSGGAGARASTDVWIPLPDTSVSKIPFPESVHLPPTVSEVHQLMWGGTIDASHTETRFDTFASMAELMKIIEPQVIARGWTLDVRTGDALQAATKFNSPKGGDSTALLLLTSLPGIGKASAMLNVYRNRGHAQTDRALGELFNRRAESLASGSILHALITEATHQRR